MEGWVYIYNASIKVIRVLPIVSKQRLGSGDWYITYQTYSGFEMPTIFCDAGEVSTKRTSYFVWLPERDDAKACEALVNRRLADAKKRLEMLAEQRLSTEAEIDLLANNRIRIDAEG